MVIAPKHQMAKIYPNVHCAKCGWPVIFVCCNDLIATTKPYAGNDWWMYCSQKPCENHAGTETFQDLPNWVERDPK